MVNKPSTLCQLLQVTEWIKGAHGTMLSVNGHCGKTERKCDIVQKILYLHIGWENKIKPMAQDFPLHTIM